MEPATTQRPYQTGPSDTNNSFFYSALLQQSMQKGKPTAENTTNPQISSPKTPRTKYFRQRKFFLFPRAIRIGLILRIVLLALQSAHQTRPCEKGKQTGGGYAIFLGSSKSFRLGRNETKQQHRVPILAACIGNSSK
jgi:hypothetical protein